MSRSVVHAIQDRSAHGRTVPEPYSREYFIERLGAEVVDGVLAKVAAAPAPSAEKVAEVRRLFAVVQLDRTNPHAQAA